MKLIRNFDQFKLTECPLVLVKWYDAHDALETGWHEWADIYRKAKLAECTSVGYLFHQDEQKIVLVADECGEFGSRITVIPGNWVEDIEFLKKSKSKGSV
jgi:hypothetical protein